MEDARIRREQYFYGFDICICVSIGHQFQSTRLETSIAELYRSEKNRTEKEYERYLDQTEDRFTYRSINEGQMLNESKTYDWSTVRVLIPTSSLSHSR
jgi:hypothetical protein